MAIREFLIRDADSNPKPPLDLTSSRELADLDEAVLTQIVQWSDLIIFDYLTGNYDRVASMQVLDYSHIRGHVKSFKNGPTMASFTFICGLFKQKLQFLQRINVKCNVHPE